MNELIKINYERRTVSARELWEFLGKPYGKFADWFKQYKEYGFIEYVDFRSFSEISEKPQGGRPTIDYEITCGMAKEIAMLQKTQKGKEIRKYLLWIEEQWNNTQSVEDLLLSPDTIIKLATTIKQERAENQKLLPRALQYDRFLHGGNAQPMDEVAKVLGWGRNKLFAQLRKDKLLKPNNVPYQEYVDRKYFVVKERPITVTVSWKEDTIKNLVQTFVTAKGFDYLSRRYGRTYRQVDCGC